MATIHISESEAAADFAGLMARVRAGAEVVIESDTHPSAVVRLAAEPRGRLLSESLVMAEKHASEKGFEPVMNPDFAADLKDIVDKRKPRDLSAWD